MSIWIALLGAGIVSYGLRVAFVAVLARRATPPWFERATAHVMPAAFAALAAPALLAQAGADEGPGAPVVVVAAVVTATVARRGHAPHRALAAGLAAVWLGSALTAVA